MEHREWWYNLQFKNPVKVNRPLMQSNSLFSNYQARAISRIEAIG